MYFDRDVGEKGPFIHGQMVMEEQTVMIVQLMATLKVSTPYLLELLVWMVIPVGLMRSALQN